MKLVKFTKIFLKDHKEINEKWLQNEIANDPTILGLGDLDLLQVEKLQPRAGRLDLLLNNPDTLDRYEVEIMLGKLDESHIIRSIEYWDIERKRYPNYKHTAVIVAEDITSRFLNVLSLFNGNIPIIALQLNVYEIEKDKIFIDCAKVLDAITLGNADESETIGPPADKDYWINKAGAQSIDFVLEIEKEILKEIKPTYKIGYQKHYIGVKDDTQAVNFAIFGPRKSTVVWVKLKASNPEAMLAEINDHGLDGIQIDKDQRVNFKLRKGDLSKNKEFLIKIFKESNDYFTS